MKEHIFTKEWIDHYKGIFSTMYPEVDKKEIKSFLIEQVETNIKNPKGQLHNNYVNKSMDIDLLTLIDWFHTTKPIAAGFGLFFKNQNEVLNPNAVMLSGSLDMRAEIKKFLKIYDEDTYEYAEAERGQKNEKVVANSFYGASGAKTSNFFNLYTATSVTATGQSLISTTETAFESFLTNNTLFIDLNDCMCFLKNIISEKCTIDDDFLPNISVELLMTRLKKTFFEYKEEYHYTLFLYLMNLSQKQLNRIYFKNNLYEFSKLMKMKNKLYKIINKVDSFRDPNKVPDIIKDDIKDLWDYYKEFVFYNYPAFNRIQRLKNDKRKTVVVVDTDSNMLNLEPWTKFLDSYIIKTNYKLKYRDENQLIYISINIMCYLLTCMIKDVLAKYTKTSNIPKEYRCKINMKNEFLFSKLILSSKKKRYINSILLREGKEMRPEKPDIKGHDFVKSSTCEDSNKFFTRIVREKLLYTDNINISDILKELEKFEKVIRKSLEKGERNFLTPKSVKELEAYKDPFKEQGVRGIITWNYLYPDMEISLPEKVDIIKVKLTNEKEIEPLKFTDPDIYKCIQRNIFGNPEEKISKKGVQVIAVPKQIGEIPKWIVPYIDYDTIVNDNISKFYSVLEALGIETIKTSKKEYFSGILKI